MKTPHRITGSILAIVLAATSALPAAGIPQIKAPPTVKAAPKIVSPPKVPVAPKVPAVKVPSVPKVPTAPKVPVVKVPSVPKIPSTPKVPVVKVPATPKTPAVRVPTVKVPVTPKIPAVKAPVAKVPEVTKTPAVRSAVVISKPISVKTGTSSNGNTIASITSAPPSDTRATAQGGDGSKKSKKEGRDLISAFRDQTASDNAKGTDGDPYFNKGGFDRDQFRADERLTNAVEVEQITGDSPDEKDGTVPVSRIRGRIKDLAAIAAEAQIAGIEADDPVLQDIQKKIREGSGIDTSDLKKLKNEIANRGIDLAFGEAPPVSVEDLTRRGDELLKAGKRKEADEKFDQAKDALKNGGVNSAEFRANVIADVQLGKRPISDLAIVVQPNTGGQTGSAGSQSGGNPSGSASGTPERNEPTSEKPAPVNTAPDDRVPTDPATGKAADRRPGAGTGADTAAGGSPATTTPGRDVSAEIDFSDIDFEPDAPTDSSLVPIEPADEFYAPDGAAEPGATPPSDDDDILSPAPAGNGNGEQGTNNGNDDDDDKDDDKNTDTPATETETEAPDAPAEENDDTAEASEEGTPNPEARDRNGYTGRLADKTGGRLGGDEQRRQSGALDQRKNGNGTGGPNPEANTSSGVLLTREEQSAFEKNLGMKRGGGVTTPTEESNTVAVTDRDLKDIAARRGSTINPAGGNGDKGGSGQTLGKKGFAPAGGVPAPAPRGVQAVRSTNIQVDTAKVQQKAR